MISPGRSNSNNKNSQFKSVRPHISSGGVGPVALGMHISSGGRGLPAFLGLLETAKRVIPMEVPQALTKGSAEGAD